MLTCGIWVQKGVAKEVPDKITLAEEDLKQLVEETKDKIKNIEGNEDLDLDEEFDAINAEDDISDEEIEENIENNKYRETNTDNLDEDEEEEAIKAEYGLENYDEEGAIMTGAGMTGLAYFASNDEDPYISLKEADEDEEEDSMIRKTDNMFVIGKMEEEYSSLDVYVFNEEEGSLYVHHDILLESFPLCLEWLSYDPGAEGKTGNYVAVGTMEPDIQIWDLDVVDTIEPAFILGGKKKKKKKKKKKPVADIELKGHTDAVLSLSWNKNLTKCMASASADQTVLLWDMSTGACVHTFKHHTDKVQSISWHPVEAQSLLTGAFDKTAAVVDCRSPDVLRWSLSGECEQVVWDHFSPYHFFVSTDDGVVSYFDFRTTTPVFKVHAHDQEVTGVSLSKSIPSCFTTVSADETLKVWSYKDNKPQCVLSRDMKMGGLNFVTSCPDIGLTYALGGQKDGLRVMDLLETNQGKAHFIGGGKKKSKKSKDEASENINNANDKTHATKENGTAPVETEMETENAVEAFATLSLKKDSENKETVIIKKKKKKKK